MSEITKNQPILYNELIDLIFSYLDPMQLLCIQKKYYKKYHPLLKSRIISIKYNYETYIRDLIERDRSFVFQHVLDENAEKWLYYKNITYRTNHYSNYIYFLLHYCCENSAVKCLQLIDDYLEKKGLSQNRHKKNTNTNIRWKTLGL
jgi:hypothetical protein